MRKQQGKIKLATEARRYRRKLAIRSKISGSAERPRIVAHKSNKNLSVQIIDDNAATTIASVQTYGKGAIKASNNVEGAKLVGAAVADAMKGKNIETAVFDRAGYRYHGVITALVEAVRENGIKI